MAARRQPLAAQTNPHDSGTAARSNELIMLKRIPPNLGAQMLAQNLRPKTTRPQPKRAFSRSITKRTERQRSAQSATSDGAIFGRPLPQTRWAHLSSHQMMT